MRGENYGGSRDRQNTPTVAIREINLKHNYKKIQSNSLQ
jgi:hypothetical protein